ncbi:growth hormone secretagogue receptor type 1 isoform X2 [Harmonia axyridis]|uniref:growth hormone secretagogue receptor type 1 isoform X2 n=1 Tax=Harmonia axyridis TaxID=115357 RepID=UPI001E276A42|nr:growth hormone secretagogue receptor type 1 isoform X2 [Harmonia axyridis]XP_045473568.1 growth hormone secretagogue receptor type 1 isoform X2 [Harmonia axyridis]
MISTLLALPSTTSSFHPTSALDLNSTAANFLYLATTDDELFFNGTFPNGTNLTFTSFKTPVFPTYLRVISMVFCIIIMCLGVIGNVMVPIVIFKTKDMRNSTNIFLVNLAVADLMVLLVCTPTVLVEVNSALETWVLGKEMCKAVPFVELTVAHASVLTILAISFERYYAICKPLKASYICTKARASLICLLAWIIAAVFTSPVLSITKYTKEPYFDGTPVYVCFSSALDLWPCIFFGSCIVIFFLVPLVILICVYVMIAKTLITHPTSIASMKMTSTSNQNVLKYRKQVILMLGTVVLSFFICLMPFRALTLWIIIGPQGSTYKLGLENYYNILYFSRIMFHLNSAINPILYNIMSSKFRGGFFRICGLKHFRKRFKRKPEILRKSTTSSSAHTSSQQTSESFLSNSGRRKRKFSSSLKEVKERTSIERAETTIERENLKGTSSCKDCYIRAPVFEVNGEKMPCNEIFV